MHLPSPSLCLYHQRRSLLCCSCLLIRQFDFPFHPFHPIRPQLLLRIVEDSRMFVCCVGMYCCSFLSSVSMSLFSSSLCFGFCFCHRIKPVQSSSSRIATDLLASCLPLAVRLCVPMHLLLLRTPYLCPHIHKSLVTTYVNGRPWPWPVLHQYILTIHLCTARTSSCLNSLWPLPCHCLDLRNRPSKVKDSRRYRTS